MKTEIFKKLNKRWLIGSLIALVVVVGGIGTWYFLPDPATVDPQPEEEELITPIASDVDISTQLLIENTTEFEVQESSRCVNFDFATTQWKNPLAKRNIELLNPTMLRFRSSDFVEYFSKNPNDFEAFAALISDLSLETLIVVDATSETLLEEIKIMKDLENGNQPIRRIEVDSSFPDLYSDQLNETLTLLQSSFPNSVFGLRGDYPNQILRDFSYEYSSLPLPVASLVQSYEDLDIEFGLALDQPKQALNRQLSSTNNQKPKWITSYRLDEDIEALPGSNAAPYQNLQLGGTWGQAMFTSFGYAEILEEEIELVCIDTLAGSPQNSLYFLSENTSQSSYPVLDGNDWELTANGQAFYMVSQASQNAIRQYRLDNDSELIKVWVFEDAESSKAWLLNGGPSTVFVDMADYGFTIDGFEMKKANFDAVVLNRSDVTTLSSQEYEESFIQLEPYSITTLDLSKKDLTNQGEAEGSADNSESEDTTQ